MGYSIKVNNPGSAWNEKSDGSVKQALRRQAEMVEAIAASQIFVNKYGDRISDEIREAARNVREGRLEAMHALIVYAGKCSRVSGFAGAVACLQMYVQRMKAAIQCGEEQF